MRDPLLKDYKFIDSSSCSSSSTPTTTTTTTTARSTISTSESGQELWPVGVKLGIVRLGHSAGKLKYTLVDEQDIILAREYTFEARLEIGKQGTGAVVFAYAYLTNSQSHSNSILLQDLIWRRHRGPIPERKRVVHRNHISMDNRLDNLSLIDIADTHVWYTSVNMSRSVSTSSLAADNSANSQAAAKSSPNDLHLTLYWAAIQQLPPESVQPNESPNSAEALAASIAAANSARKCYDSEGNLINDQEGRISYYECHYAPCVRIERAPREFSICGRCQEARYCGTVCQQLDWPHHKRYCRVKARRSSAPYYQRRWIDR